MFDTIRMIGDCQTQTTPCFEGRCDCPRISGMEHQSPTPPLSGPGSSILTACDRELTSPPELSPLWTTNNDRSFKREDSHHFAVDLQRALSIVGSCPEPPEEDSRQYIAIRDIHPSYYDSSPPQYFQYPTYQQVPSYASYHNHAFGPLSPAPTKLSESPTMSQFSSTYLWPASQDSRNPFDGHRDETYFKISPEDEDDDTLCDKPYARLIYDALMQAPGHRMMLREIYEWFQQHTTKPAESGTNGWQNSIRHNLSMNQAFENDKSDLCNPAGQKQKVNSVWVLTENAVRNGVQSTTRYRRTGSGKRTNINRIPAPLRQRSGAKGGKAARRAAQLRKKEDHLHRTHDPTSPLRYAQTSLYSYDGNAYDGADSSDAFSIPDPTTPTPDFCFGGEPEYQTSRYPTATTASPLCRSSDPACVGDPDQNMHDFGYHSASDITLEEMLRVHRNSVASRLST